MLATKSSFLYLSFSIITVLAVGSAEVSVHFLQKRDEICPPNVPADVCIFIPFGVTNCNSCSSLENLNNCQTTSCICNQQVASQYASCLQCATNNYAGNTADLSQGFLDEYVRDCSLANFAVPDSSITAPANEPTQTSQFGGGNNGPFSGGPDSGDGNVGVSTGLALGAIIGIAVGVPVGTLVIFGGLGWIMAAHVKSRRQKMLAGYYNLNPNGY